MVFVEVGGEEEEGVADIGGGVGGELGVEEEVDDCAMALKTCVFGGGVNTHGGLWC